MVKELEGSFSRKYKNKDDIYKLEYFQVEAPHNTIAECLADDLTFARHVTCRASMWVMMGEDELEVAAERI